MQKKRGSIIRPWGRGNLAAAMTAKIIVHGSKPVSYTHLDRLPGTGWCPGTAAVFDRSSGWCKRPAYPGVGAAGSAADGTAVL